MIVSRWRVCIALMCGALAAPGLTLQAQVDVVGNWHGFLTTPTGRLTLIVTISQEADGRIQGTLEVPEQLPGRKIPMTSVTVTDQVLAFTLQPLGASWEGKWDATEQHWSGTWKQGMDLPLQLVRGTPDARPALVGLDGVWNGKVQRNGTDLRLVLRVTTGKQGTIMVLDSPDLGGFNIPVTEAMRRGDSVGFHVPASGARWRGVLDTRGEGADRGSRMMGVWTLPGRPDAEVAFVRSDTVSSARNRARPQTPKEPFDYGVESVKFDNPDAEGVTLAGTLTLPEGKGPFPVAILISGSGPQDRDETVWGHKPFAVLADHLTRHGIAALRYDDRGFGESTGDHGSATSADFATDANAAVRYLLTRPEINHGAIGLVGHSEGGMIGPLAAVDNEAVAFLVLLAGPGTSTAQLIRSQARLIGESQGVSAAEVTRSNPVRDTILAVVASATSTEDAENRIRALLTPAALEALGVPTSQAERVVKEYGREWFRFFLQYDAAAVLSRLRIPVLALNGSLDQQVPADENLAGIRAALTGHPDVTIQKLEGLNHLFQTSRTGALGEYADIEETLSPTAMVIVVDWIMARYGPVRAGNRPRP